MTRSPEISVIIPVFGQADRLSSALASLDRQDAVLEIIIVDDGNPDPISIDIPPPEGSTLTILRNDKNQGTFLARQRGVEAASAPFVTFLDSDDQLSDGACRVMLDTLADSGADLGSFGIQKVAHDGKDLWTRIELPESGGGPYGPQDKLTLLKRALSGEHAVDPWFRSQCATLFDVTLLRQVYDFIGDPPQRLVYMEDTLVKMHAFCMSQRSVLSDARVYRYLQNPTSITRQQSVDIAIELCQQVAIIIPLIERGLISIAGSEEESREIHQIIQNFEEQSIMMIAIGHLRFPRVKVDPNDINRIAGEQPAHLQSYVRTMLNLSVRLRWVWIWQNRLGKERRAAAEYNKGLKERLEELRKRNAKLEKAAKQ